MIKNLVRLACITSHCFDMWSLKLRNTCSNVSMPFFDLLLLICLAINNLFGVIYGDFHKCGLPKGHNLLQFLLQFSMEFP